MDKKELEAGLEEAAAAEALAQGEGAAWAPDMGWLMGNFGPFFNNNQGIGELLLGKLMESGVNTEGVALAGLVNVLQQFSQEYKALSDAVGKNLDRINELSSDNEKLADSIQEVIKSMNITEDEGGTPPMMDEGAGEMPPPDMGAMGMDAGIPPDGGEMPPPDMGGAGGIPPDAGAGMDAGAPPPDMGGADMGAGAPPPPPDMAANTVSDSRMKKPLSKEEIAGIVSDRRMKRLEAYNASRKPKAPPKNNDVNLGIIEACTRGY